MCTSTEERSQGNAANGHLKPRERLQEKPTLLTSWPWTCSLQNSEEILCYGSSSKLIHPDAGIIPMSHTGKQVYQSSLAGATQLVRDRVSPQTRSVWLQSPVSVFSSSWWRVGTPEPMFLLGLNPSSVISWLCGFERVATLHLCLSFNIYKMEPQKSLFCMLAEGIKEF